MAIHLKGIVTLPLQGAHSFLVHSEDGKEFYVIDSKQVADVHQYQYVDITASATSHAFSVSDNQGLTTDIYQFIFQKHTQH